MADVFDVLCDSMSYVSEEPVLVLSPSLESESDTVTGRSTL